TPYPPTPTPPDPNRYPRSNSRRTIFPKSQQVNSHQHILTARTPPRSPISKSLHQTRFAFPHLTLLASFWANFRPGRKWNHGPRHSIRRQTEGERRGARKRRAATHKPPTRPFS